METTTENTKTSNKKEVSVNFSIPTRSIWSLIGLVILGGFTFIQAKYYIFVEMKILFSLNSETLTLEHVGYFWIPIIGYLLIAGNILLLIRIFKPLKDHKKVGLIDGLIFGLIFGLIDEFKK